MTASGWWRHPTTVWCVSLLAVWLSVGLLVAALGMGFTAGLARDQGSPSAFRYYDRQATVGLYLYVMSQCLLAAVLAWRIRWGYWLLRVVGALVASSALTIFLAYSLFSSGQGAWVKPAVLLMEQAIGLLVRGLDAI